MTNDVKLLAAMLEDADRAAYYRDILKTSGFLSMDEQNVYHRLKNTFSSRTHFLYGGHEDADRNVCFFMPDHMDRETAVSEVISAVAVRPVNERFAEKLDHRDYLGALMNLGIERSCIGDILTDENSCIVFCLSKMVGLITGELTRVRHTAVRCEPVTDMAKLDAGNRFEELHVNVAAERLDAVIAAVFRIPRPRAAALIEDDKVSVSGREKLGAGKVLKEGDRVSVRGYGKFIFDGINGSSKSGRLFVNIRKFI